MKVPNDLLKLLEAQDYTITIEDGVAEVGKYSPAGQDFHFCVDLGDNLDEFAYNALMVYQDFDVSAETYLWLDNTGHGTNGAPYDMKELYEDMETCQEYIRDFYSLIYNFAESKK